MRRPVLLLACVALLVAPAAARAQDADPPDRQAFRAARLLPDPQQALDALAKVAADYPKSRYAERARAAVLDILVRSFPSRTKAIERQIGDVLAATAKDDRAGVADDLAIALVEGGVLLDRARRLSEMAVKGIVEEAFVSSATREAAAAKMPPPNEARVRRSYRHVKALVLGTLGRVYAAQGKAEKARRTFTAARALEPTLAAAAEGLGALALADGREQTAYDEFLLARLNGVLTPANQRAFEGLFATRHNGSLVALDATLDAAYRAAYPNPIPADRARAGGQRSDRAVLLEVFTGAGCPPCAAADLAVDAALEHFGVTPAEPGAAPEGRSFAEPARSDVIVLMYHQHVPRPDPMTNPDTVARSSAYNVQGVPTLVVDGVSRFTGGGPREDAPQTYARLLPLLERQLAEPAAARLDVTASMQDATVRVHVTAAVGADGAAPARTPGTRAAEPAGAPDGGADALTLRVVLVEEALRYSGENGIRFHPMVVRAVAEMPLTGGAASIDHTFDVRAISQALQAYLDEYERRNDRFGPVTFIEKKAAIDASRLRVVAFVQRSGEPRVLQSAVTAVRPPRERVSQ